MKKILKVLALALVALIAASPMTIDAQTRKSGAKKTATTRKTTSTAKKSTTPAKTSGTAAAKSEVEPSKPARESYIKLLPEAELNIGDFGSGASYQGYVDAGLENGFMLYTTLSFSTDNSNLYLNVAGNSCENGKWSLNANHLTATSDGGNFDLSSPDKGHILDGIFTNAKGTKSNMIAYAVAENECYPNKLAALIKKIADKEILGAYITVYAKDLDLGFPVKFSVNKENGMSWEVTSDNPIISAIGTLQGKVKVTEFGTVEWSIPNGSVEAMVSDKDIQVKFGSCDIPGLGRALPELHIYY